MDAFFNFDGDKDRYISCEDLIIIMMTKGAKMSREEASQFANEVDFDHDGHVAYQEATDYLLQE